MPLDRLVRLGAKLACPQHLHSDDALAGCLHLLQDFAHHFGRCVHRGSGGVPACKIHFHPGTFSRSLERTQRVATRTLGPDDALLFGLAQNIHRTLVTDIPIVVDHAVHQQDIDVVGSNFAAKTVKVRTHVRGGKRTRLAHDRHLVARHGFQRFLQVRMAAVLIRGIPEEDALIMGGAEQFRHPLKAKLLGLIRTATHPVRPRAHRQPRHWNFCRAQ